MRHRLEAALAAIAPVNQAHAREAQDHLDNLTKPKGSLGRLEELAVRALCAQRSREERLGLSPDRLTVAPGRILTIAGDHGVAGPDGENVSLFPQAVTRQMVANFLAGGAAVSVLARTAGMDLVVVDAGVAGDDFPEAEGLVRGKVRPGTANLAKEAAMSESECLKALALGMDLARQAAADGCCVLGIGDMGIGNTTASTALYCAYLGLDPAAVTGPGTGLDPKGVAHKAQVVAKALALHKDAVASGDALAVLAALGGLEIAALAGAVLGAAAQGLLVLVDGFIATAAFAAAWKTCPAVKDWCVFSHASAEPGHAAVLRAVDAEPLLDLGMRLGEGTGAALAFMLLRASADIYNNMATFAGAGVSTST